MECRLIFDPPAEGAWNMAMDEALREAAGRAGQGGCLRFYGWQVPTISLGYFQHHADRRTHESSCGCPLVRRATGGGAIVHDRELTYSYTTAIGTHIRSGLASLYEVFHQGLIEELARHSIAARLCRNPPPRPREQEPFLCFQRRAERDVLLGDAKIAGSAQRRHRETLLQHGSVLLHRSVAAPELEGIWELASVKIDPRELAEGWAKRVAASLGLTLRPEEPMASEREAADRFCQAQFANPRWNERR
jgi:lipoate-protein ligase A